MFNISCNQSIILDYYTHIGLCQKSNSILINKNIIYLPYNLPPIEISFFPPLENIMTSLFISLSIYFLVLLIKMLKNNLH